MPRAGAKTPTKNDTYIGERIREARVSLKMSQDHLAQLIGVSYQQIQKYEAGKNRVNGARIELLVTALNRPLTYFFPHATDVRSRADPVLAQFISSKEGYALATQFPRLSPGWRGALLTIISRLSKEQP